MRPRRKTSYVYSSEHYEATCKHQQHGESSRCNEEEASSEEEDDPDYEIDAKRAKYSEDLRLTK
jgi:hypothetical protein